MKTKIKHTSIQNNLHNCNKNADNASSKENADNSEDSSSIKSRDFNSKYKKLIVILGDSMLQHLNGWEMSKKVRVTARYLLNIFQTQQQIAWRMKSFLRKNPNHITLHVGTNDLILDRTSQDIATSKVNLVCSMKGKNCDFSISNIILRTDNKKLNEKRQEVDTYLKYMCNDKFIYLIGNTNKIKAQLLNKGKLHLNKRGSHVDL